MMLEVLNRVAADTGLSPTNQRATLVALLNLAAKEIYDRLECNKIFWEVTLAVPPNKIVTLPSYIGELRGMARSPTNELLIPIHPIGAPRYVSSSWEYRWKNWRDLGENPTMVYPSVVGPLTISCAKVEDEPVTLFINGQTNKALRIEEQIEVSATSQQTTNLFGPQIYSISCPNVNRTVDINIADANGQLLAVLYNMDLYTRYKMIDVSECPWSMDTNAGNALIDILYKVLLRKLSLDSDNFPAGQEFNTSWYWMAMYLYYKPMKNKPVDYENFFPNAMTSLKSAKGTQEDALLKKMSFGPNRYYDLTMGCFYPEPYVPCTHD